MFRLYFIIEAKIDRLKKQQLQTQQRLFVSLEAAKMNAQLFFWEFVALFIRFFIVLFGDTAKGFAHLLNQREANVCSYSYADYRKFQRRLRTFSLSGLLTFAAAAAIVGLVLNLLFGGKLPGFAATFGWVQTKWDASPTPGYIALHDQAAWGNATTTKFEALDGLVTINNPAPGDSFLSEGTTTSNLKITDDSVSSTGFMYNGLAFNQTQLVNFGTSTSLVLGISSSTTFNLGGNTVSTPSFRNPSAIFLDATHNKVYVADTNNNRVVRYDSGGGGTTLGANFQSFGSSGSGGSQFLLPKGIVVDASIHKVFVADSNNGRIVSFEYDETTMGGNFSFASGFWQPSQLDIDLASKKIFVADTRNDRIVVVDYGSGLVAGPIISNPTSTSTDQFSFPGGVAYDALHGKIYVANSNRHQVHSCDYNLSTGTTSNWEILGGFNNPQALVSDPNRSIIYVSDTGNNLLKLLDVFNGNFFASSSLAFSDAPYGLYLDDSSYKLYVANNGLNAISVMDSYSAGTTFGGNPQAIGNIGTGVSQYNTAKDIFYDPDNYKIYLVDGTRVIRYDSGYGGTTFGGNWQIFSSSTNSFRGPGGIYVDRTRNKVYLADKDRLIRFDTGIANGTTFGGQWQETPITDTNTIKDIYIDETDEVAYFIRDEALPSISLGTVNVGAANFGTNLHLFGTFGMTAGKFRAAQNIFVDSATNRVFVVDNQNNRLVNFTLNYTDDSIESWHEVSNWGDTVDLNGAWLDSRNNTVYVGDVVNNKIFKVGVNLDFSFDIPVGANIGVDSTPFKPKELHGDVTNNKLYIIDDYYRVVRTDISATVNTYYSSGTYTTGAVETGQKNLAWGVVSWDSRTNGQTMTIKARGSQYNDMSDAQAWVSCSDLANGQTLIGYACVRPSDRFIQYQVTMSTSYELESPYLNDISVDFTYYPSNQTLTSLIYDTTDTGNVLGSLSWNENQNDANIYASLSLRSAASSADLAAAAWQTINLGNDCAKAVVSGLVSCDFDQLKSDLPALYDGVNDQFFQYRINLLSPGDIAPAINSVNVSYIINIKPDAEITNTPIQASDGTVQINYRVRDIDTVTGSTTGKVYVDLEYWNGLAWAKASSSDFKAGSDAGLVDVEVASSTDWRDYTLTWLASSSYPGQFFATSSGFKVRVAAHDSEIANNTGYGPSTDFRLDTKAPDSPHLQIDASQTTGAGQIASLDFFASDDSDIEMRVGLDANLADAGAWAPFMASTSIILPTDPDSVYVQFKDAHQNISSIVAATHPSAPANEIIRDITSPSAEIFQLFLAWKKDSDPSNFKQYVVYRSADEGVTYEKYATIASSSINYFFDSSFEFAGSVVTKKYYYRVAIENLNGDLSHYNLLLADIPDGQGVNINPPIIATSSVSSFATSTQTATIVWDTNVESNSAIGYSTIPGEFTNIVGVSTMRDNALNFGSHSVVITGLSASTTYYFQVRSTDAYGYTVTRDTDESNTPYSFTTLPGPVITNVSTSSITKSSATITWDTSLPADATVIYSASTSFANALQVTNSGTLELAHVVNLANLENNTRYYYYVASKDTEGYETIGMNFVDGAYVNYDFTTLADTALPESTSTSCSKSGDNALLLSWLTEKPAISRILYGPTSGTYGSSTSFTQNYDTAQTALIGSLTASTSYYFISVNADQSNNFSTSSEFTCTTNEKLITDTEAQTRIQDAYNAGKADGAAPQPQAGGGFLIIDKNDKVAPLISDSRVLDVSTSSAKLMWRTEEGASSFVEYGTSLNYDSNWGRPDLTKVHIAEIRGMQPNTVYHYRLASADASGNFAQSSDQVIKTLSLMEVEPPLGLSTTSNVAEEMTSLRAFMEKILEGASLDGFDGSLISQYNLLQKLAEAMPTPVFTGSPVAVTTMESASITWQTDKNTNSLIALATDDVFLLNKDKREPYYRLEGEPYEFVQNHKITLSDLKPGTLYHFQARSRAQLGLVASTKDYTFRTQEEGLSITNFNSEVISGNQVLFKWLTSQETDAQLRFTPYHDSKLAVDEAKIVEDRKLSKKHELAMRDLEPGMVYQVEMSGIGYNRKKVIKTIPTFTTAKDDLPPQIYQIQTESALSQGKTKTVQAIISWTTDEPTKSEFSFEKGVSDKIELAETLPFETSYSKKHVLVLTKFASGQVYSFRIKAVDSTGNSAISDAHTILTPKQKEGVFELIMRNFESTFGWLRDVRTQ